jgi:hypothetical protein
MFEINGRTYADDELVDWATAQAVGGPLFSRAEYLGCPLPPASAVANTQKTDEQLRIFGRWYGIYKDLEADQGSEAQWNGKPE